MNIKHVLAMQKAAKELWGDEELTNPYLVPKDELGGKFTGNAFLVVTKKGWKRHLESMVTSDDPALYLKENS